MKRFLLLSMITLFGLQGLQAQVTQLVANKNMELRTVINQTISIYSSDIDSTLWATDGTVAGTKQLSTTIKITSSDEIMLGNKYIFTGISSGTGEEWFITDGTIAGTKLIKDINPGTPGSIPDNITLIELNGYLYFPAITAANGCELWKSDGTTANTTMVKDINPGTADGIPRDDGSFDFFILNTNLYFPAVTTTAGYELWKSDGSTANTNMVMDINPGTASSQPLSTAFEKMVYKNYLYFVAVNSTNGCELWRTNGSTTSIVKDIVAGTGSGIDSANFSMSVIGTNLVFKATAPTTTGGEFWYTTDGTSANTNILKDITPGTTSSNLPDLDEDTSRTVGNIYIFAVPNTAGTSADIWRTDGTPAGTFTLLTNVSTGTAMTNYNVIFYNFKNNAYFLVDDNVHTGTALWKTDGIDATSSHTVFLKDLGSSGSGFLNILNSVAFPSKFVFFYPTDNTFATYSMWQCDGTVAGTSALLTNFPAGPNQLVLGGVLYVPDMPSIFPPMSFDIANLSFSNSLYNGKFFFSAYSTTNGRELWISNGTAAGTNMVKDINPGINDGIGNIYSFQVLYTQQGLFFPATNGANGIELWRSDGTSANTVMVKDIHPGADSSNPQLNFVLVNGKIFFNANDGTPGDESITDLYVVDGIFSPMPVQLINFTVTPQKPDALLKWSTSQEINSSYFDIQSSDDAQHWNSIGKENAMGNSSIKTDYSYIDRGIMNSGKNVVYYRLNSVDIDGKNSYSNVISLRINNTDQWNVQIYSNPVKGNLNLMLTGLRTQAFISIHDLSGKEIYKRQLNNENGMFSIPLNVQAGVYILRVRSANETRTLKFVKE